MTCYYIIFSGLVSLSVRFRLSSDILRPNLSSLFLKGQGAFTIVVTTSRTLSSATSRSISCITRVYPDDDTPSLCTTYAKIKKSHQSATFTWYPRAVIVSCATWSIFSTCPAVYCDCNDSHIHDSVRDFRGLYPCPSVVTACRTSAAEENRGVKPSGAVGNKTSKILDTVL